MQLQDGLLSLVDIDGSEEAIRADVEKVTEKEFRWEEEVRKWQPWFSRLCLGVEGANRAISRNAARTNMSNLTPEEFRHF